MLPAARDRGYGRSVIAASLLALGLLGPATETAEPEAASGESVAGSAPAPVLPEPEPAAEPEPGPARPPQAPATPGPEPEPEEAFEYELRDPRNLPIAPTPARKSALLRGNEVSIRPFRKPVFSAAAAFRFGILAGGGLDVMQPFGYGFGAQIRAHLLPVARARFGLELHAGHTRWSERDSFETFEGSSIERTRLLTATDVSLGPSLEVPIGPIFIQLGGSAGMAVSSLTRPTSADALDDEGTNAINFALRGGLSLGIPVFQGHGLSLFGAFSHVFSDREVAVELAAPDGDSTRPFGSTVEVGAAYTIWF